MSDRNKISATNSKEKKECTGEPEPKRKRKIEATGSLRHQIAPLDSIMEEMEKEVQRKKELAAAAAAAAAAIAHETEPKIEVCRLTRDALENMPLDNTMVFDFVNRDCIMYQLLGHKMMEGRLQAYPNLGYVKSDSAIMPPFAYDRIGPRTPPIDEQICQPIPRRGPKTPPGSPGPRTPPSPPPQKEDKSNILANVAALTGSNVSQLEAYFGSELSEALGSMEKTALLEKIKDALISTVGKKKDEKVSPPTDAPRRSKDTASVKMELVSDGSLTPDRPNCSSPVVAPPPPPPIIEPPPRPPTFASNTVDVKPSTWAVKEEMEDRSRLSVLQPGATPGCNTTTQPTMDMLSHPFMQPPPPMIPPPTIPIYPPVPPIIAQPSVLPPPPLGPPLHNGPNACGSDPPTIMVTKISLPATNCAQNLPKVDLKITPIRSSDKKTGNLTRGADHASTSNETSEGPSTPARLTSSFHNNAGTIVNSTSNGVKHRGSTQMSPVIGTTFKSQKGSVTTPTNTKVDNFAPALITQTVNNTLLSALGLGNKISNDAPKSAKMTSEFPKQQLQEFANQRWSHEKATTPQQHKGKNEFKGPVSNSHSSPSTVSGGNPSLHRGHGPPRPPLHSHHQPVHHTMHHPSPHMQPGPNSGPRSLVSLLSSPLPPPPYMRGNGRFRGNPRRSGCGGRPLRPS